MTEAKVLKAFTDVSSTGSFGGVERLKQLFPDLTRAKIKRILETSNTYTKHKQIRHTFLRRKVMVPVINYLWQIDIVVLNKYRRFNKGYGYIFNCIDCLSRYAFSVPIFKKTASECVRAFEVILKKGYGQCKYIESDEDTAFYSKAFLAMLKKHNITLYSNYSDKGASLIERYQRTLLNRINKYMTENKTKTYVNVLDQIVDSYNRSYHQSIKRAPVDVDENNQSDVWMTVYAKHFTKNQQQKSNLKVGDIVRIKSAKGIFSKGYTPNFSEKLYKVCEVISSIPETYKICDGGTQILGTFYKQELSQMH